MPCRLPIRALALCALAALAACSNESSTDVPPAPLLMSASPDTAPADGASFVVITVTNGRPPITLSTTRGTFENGSTTTQLASVPNTALLRSCDARVTASCAGPAGVTASDQALVRGSVVVTFTGFENCANGRDDNGDGAIDCADGQCPFNTRCSPTGLVCGATGVCNKCDGNGGVAEPAAERTCDDGNDNDCDGDADCDDPDCDDRICATAANATGVCTAGACACAVNEDVEASCGDGRDNDCDGLADCADPSCRGVVCDGATGRVCSGTAPSTCTVCPTGLASEGATQCADGRDNDCDGVFDCADADCQPAGGAPGRACNAFGGTCILTAGVPSCGCPTGATVESTCSGGVDDDCDGRTDCADADCQPGATGGTGGSCSAFGRVCTSDGACECPGTSEVCNNVDGAGAAIDDDCDGRANCADPDCRPTQPGQLGQDCSGQDQFGRACDATGACVCSGNGGTPQVAEVTCDDGFDNDCDFLVDCQDPSCATRSCGTAGAVCTGGACACPGGATTEAVCDDRLDDDCNGRTDCEEAACASVACDPANPQNVCISGTCSDPVTQYGVTVVPARTRLPAQPGATTDVEVTVTFQGQARPGVPVTLAVAPALGTITTAQPQTTNQFGKVTVQFQASGPVGAAVVTATVDLPAPSSDPSGSATIDMPGIGEIRLLTEDGVQYPVMGVRTSGWQEQNLLQVEVVDVNQLPYPAGLDVTFRHNLLGASTLSSPLPADATCPAASCVRSRVQTDAQGIARVSLYSGTVAGTMRVSASASTGSPPATRAFELPAIAAIGAKANAGHFSLVCDTLNVPALAETTCHVSLIQAPFNCVALLKDRYNNVLGRSTTVSFMSEAGSVGQPSTTPEYDPAQPPTGQGDLGTGATIINTLGGKLPKDVTAVAGEASYSRPTDVCGVSERSPRDGLVTVVAWTPGEEDFFDENGNGVFDGNDVFIDLPEPFVDYDDDDVRDADEPFIDTDADGVWDPPNGQWDANTNVWTKTVVVYTGMPAFLRVAAGDQLSRWMESADAGAYPAATPAASFAVRPEFPPDPFVDCNGNSVRDLLAIETFTDTNQNGTYEPGVDTLADCNGNGLLDAGPVPESFTDLTGNGYNAGIIPPTSESFVVSGSDVNLNRLSAGTTYAVEQPEGTTFELQYSGQASLPDRLGLGYAFRPCLASAPATCALDCSTISTPASRVCVLRTALQGFSYGYTAGVTIVGGAQGDSDGSTAAFWDLTLFGETLRISIPGTHQ
jgi:hypothetical protein